MATLTASAPVSLPSVPAPRLLRAALPLLIAAPVVLGVQAGGVWVLAQLAKPEPAASAPVATTAAPRTAAPLFASTTSSVPVLAKAPAAEAAAPPAPVISRAATPEVPAGERPVPAASVEPVAGKPVTATPAQAPAPGPDAGPVQAASAPEAPVARVEAVAPKPAPAPADTADAAPPAVSPVSPTPPAVSPVTRPAASVLYVPPPYVPVAPYAVAAAQAPARAAVAPVATPAPVAHPAGDKAPAPAPAGTEPERQELLGPDWVRAQPVNNRTLQLMAGSSLEVLREYVRSHDFADVPVAYIPSLRDGQPWYYLIAGSFASVQESSAAERVLKNVQSGLKPWTRRFGGMQALIKP
ncbi:SPOR domain-containing protein [Plasticicumulans sp.]|uniref:SPOR domain-containing protein n=1 Tax=Plasticicumulans sp. TaxID=2307179 RepID=UPI003932CB52